MQTRFRSTERRFTYLFSHGTSCTVVCVAAKYDPGAQNGGHGNLPESSRDRIRIRASIERTRRSKKTARCRRTARAHQPWDQGTRPRYTKPFYERFGLPLHADDNLIRAYIAGNCGSRCHTLPDTIRMDCTLSMPGMQGRKRKCMSLRAGLQGTALP